ncbi:MAG: FAD-binding protein [Dethiosulfatibacter sp.]|nr:FAD-binding protein [Dethiosulfatibacter sp.]
MKFKRIISTVLLFSLLVSLMACSGNESSENRTEVIKGIYTPGTYEATAQGYGGSVQVKVTVDDNKITNIVIIAEDETEGIGSKAVEELPAQIVEANGTEIDVVSGATYSSEGILKAVDEALSIGRGEKPAPKVVQNGQYVTEVVGHEGIVKVATTFLEGKITDVKVILNDETRGIGTYAVERIPSKIVETQSINVDAVSGATVTSNTIKFAVSKAIEVAGGNVSNYNKQIEKTPILEKQVEENVQVAIMGAGTAGLYAAAQLLEKGVTDVIIFEKQDIPGGTMPATFGGMIMTGSEIFDNWGLGSPTYASWDTMKERYISSLSASGREFNPEFPYMSKMFIKSGELYDWMANIGIGFNSMGFTGFPYPVFAPGVYEGGSGYAMQFLVDRIEAKGGRIIYGTPVIDLIQDETGRIKGLIAEGQDGTKWRVNADSVIIASGSFAKNKALLEQYFSEWADHDFNTIKSLTGDGLILGMKYGAGIEDMGSEIPGFLSTYDSKFKLAFMHLTVPGIIVNINGDEFGNIVRMNHKVMSEAKSDPKNGDTFYYIFDEAAAAQAYKSDVYGFDAYKAIFEKGEAVRYESLEACANALKLTNLVQTVETNNDLSLKGEPNEWGRTRLPHIHDNNGVWALRVDPTVYLTTGGLKIDPDSRVLTQEGKIIPGLYAAGDVVGSVEQKDGVTYGYGFVAAMSFGAIAAESIVIDNQ